ncbi:unnamed protein product, partial [Symbiodinium sp. KB8]
MYKPIASQHVIQFIWPLPGAVSQHGSYREAFNLVTHVLGFEGNGSILSYLRSSNVAEGVSAGYSVRGRGLTMLEVDVSLTTHAVENIGLNESAIIAASAIFRQLELLKSALPRMGEGQPLRYLWEDIIRSDVQAYEFDILDPPRRRTWDSNPAAQVVDMMTVQRLLLFIVSTKVEETWYNAHEPWYNFRYSKSDVPSEWVSRWHNASAAAPVSLPSRNVYFPANYDVVVKEDDWEGLHAFQPKPMPPPQWWTNSSELPQN